MSHTKPIVAAISSGIGIALVLVAIHLQRDRFAFTSEQPARAPLVRMTFAPPIGAVQQMETAAPAEQAGVIEIEAVEVWGTIPPPRRAVPGVEPVKPSEAPCNPVWRELESGPAGKRVREICPPVSAADVPRS
ncbi:MAG TPA: hypothetical protein VI072_13695 [Polyangiaceae bacterium]